MTRQLPIRAKVEESFEAIARLGIWIPVALAIYFFVRAFQIPYAVGPLLLLMIVVGNYFVERRARGEAKPDQDDSVGCTSQIGVLLLATGVLIIALAPVIRIAWLLGRGEYPVAFLNADESYNFMIAQGLVQGFPPPDLTYLGRVSAYHLGGPMLAEMMHRLGLASLHLAFYAIWPVVLKIVAAASIFSILGKLAATVSTEKKIIGVLATSGVFTIDFYNIIWNIRTIVKTGIVNKETIFQGMPIITGYSGFVVQELQYAAPLAITFFLVLVANLHRTNSLIIAFGLFAIFLAKSSVFVPIGAAWGFLSIYQLVRYRDIRFLAAGMIALALCLLARPFVMESGYATLGMGRGYGFDWLAGQGLHLAKALGATGGLAAAASGLGLLLVGTHVFGWAGPSLLKAQTDPRGRGTLLLFMALCMLFAALFSTFFVFMLNPGAQAGFDAIHAGIKDKLWRPVDTYIYELGKMSIGEARIVVAYGFALLGVAAVMFKMQDTRSRWDAVAGWAAILPAVAFGISQSYHLTFGPLPERMKPITISTSQALSSIPVSGSVILTNQCAYDPKVELHMPLMNAAMSGIYGHQFWACNFMFGNNFAVPNAPERLQRIQWFWGREIDNEHYLFLRGAGITHLLFDRGASLGVNAYTKLDQVPWLTKVMSNSEYLVYKIDHLSE